MIKSNQELEYEIEQLRKLVFSLNEQLFWLKEQLKHKGLYRDYDLGGK